jgi:diaminohydroxyphosphoribosylaminopyrimidine deaminase/5-amino-6-(5-phosphoribosylamino)uracil reductase
LTQDSRPGADNDVVALGTSAASPELRKALETRGVQVLHFDGPGGRADLRSVVGWLGERRYLSLTIEAGSVDRIFSYYGPKILGALSARRTAL